MTHHEPIAHLSDDGRSQPLRDHLIGTAERDGKMAAVPYKGNGTS